MTYNADISLIGPSAGTPADFLKLAMDKGSKRIEDVELYIREVYRLSLAVGFRAEVVLAQSIHEASENGVPWASLAWTHGCNPAGIGVTNDAERTKYDFGNGTVAARVHIVHLALYVFDTFIPPILQPYIALDPRWDAAIAAGHAGSAKVLRDLNGRWAYPGTTYAQMIASLLNDLASRFTTPSQPAEDSDMALTFGGMPCMAPEGWKNPYDKE